MNIENRLFNKNFILILISSFLMFSGFYLLMPIVAMYIFDTFPQVSKSTVGVVVSVYIISSLIARPFSGYLVDHFDRRKFFLVTLFVFALLFLGYIISATIIALIITRILLGATFSLVSTASNTLAIDLMPPHRRNEGISYVGVATVLSMAIGPMIGLYLIEVHSYNFLFWIAFGVVMSGFLIGTLVKSHFRQPKVHQSISLDRFFLKKGVSISMVMFFNYFLYGTLMAYMPLYIESVDEVTVSSSNFFLFLAAGIILSKISSGKLMNMGFLNQIIIFAHSIIIIAICLFIFPINNFVFLLCSSLIGVGYGLLSPSVQSMVIDLVPHHRRGTANSTFFVALDLGSGLGMLFGGIIAQQSSYKMSYAFGLGLTVLALLYYLFYARGSYNRILKKSKESGCYQIPFRDL